MNASLKSDGLIVIRRPVNGDAVQIAALAAKEHGTRLAGNIRWYGAMGPVYREIGTQDGRTIRVVEPDSLDPRAE